MPAQQAEGKLAERDNKQLSKGRPPLAQFTLTEPEIAGVMTPEQRKEVIAILTDIILTAHYRMWRADRGLPPEPEKTSGRQQEEDARQRPAL